MVMAGLSFLSRKVHVGGHKVKILERTGYNMNAE